MNIRVAGRRCLLARATSVCALALGFGSADAAPLLINEIFYDPAGTDAGAEFVELLSLADSALSLEGWRLQAGDGAGAGRWRTVWQGTAGDVLAPRARFVIGEAQRQPPPDRVATLALENGPDAVRLSSPSGEASVVGYGALAFAEYFAGTPAGDVASGTSLSRLPDGADTGDNARDFAAAPPTPGARNPSAPRWGVEVEGALATPELIAAGDSVRVRARVHGLTGDGEARRLRIDLHAAPQPNLPPLLTTPEGESDFETLATRIETQEIWIAPADTLAFEARWRPPAAGLWRLRLTASDAEADDGAATAESYVRSGLGPLIVHEILYAPPPGEPEWVEVRARGLETVDLSRFALADAGGRAALLVDAAPVLLQPDSLAVLVEDEAAFLLAHPGLDPARVHALRPWPTLNNAAAGAGPADRVRLLDDRGALADVVAYAGGDPTGYSLERRDPDSPSSDGANWGTSALRGGTPLASTSLLAAPQTVALAVSPLHWRPGSDASRLRATYRLEWERAFVRVSVIDPRGRERARLLEGPSAAVGALEWDGTAAGERVRPGAYALLLEARPASGEGRLRLMQPLVVAP